MYIEIISPDNTIFQGEAELVQCPGKTGSFEILNNHAPMIAVLKEGRIKVTGSDRKSVFFDVKGGVVEVLKNKVLILAE
ncbi:MAG: ATP synthase F1 subunit epsilon [Bacteroidales bacterium]|nr:ATP synthase F1 subunit epsilon [Bacteroidales bacterium]